MTGSGSTSGAVLMGGASSRMGRPKALLPWGDDGTPLYRAAVEALAAFGAQPVELACGAPGAVDIGDPGLGTITDAVPAGRRPGDGPFGPLAAITAALERAQALGAGTLALLPCDMPLVTPEDLTVLRRLLDGGADAALYEVDGVDQPLCALYRVATAAPAARAALDAGARRPVAVWGRRASDGRDFLVKRAHPDEISRHRLMNVNTPADYDRARKLLHESQGRPTRSPRRADR